MDCSERRFSLMAVHELDGSIIYIGRGITSRPCYPDEQIFPYTGDLLVLSS